MNTMRSDITRGDTTPTLLGAAYTALLLPSGEVLMVHPSDDPTLPLEEHDIAGITVHGRGTPHLTTLHFNLLNVEHPRRFAEALTASYLLPFLTSERMKLVEWLQINLRHLKPQPL